MHISADTHVFVVKQSWIDDYSLKDKRKEAEQLTIQLEDVKAKIAELQQESTSILDRINHIENTANSPPKCYSCGAEFQPKMLCHSKPIGPGRRQIRCISCAVRHGLITYTEYEFLVLGLEKHNRLTPEVIATAKQR